jgi:pimeloyl-ACP methyl ester carboxylesterase
MMRVVIALLGVSAWCQAQEPKLYYQECNTGASHPIVLVHDGVVNSAVWDDVWPDFCRTFHTIRYDRRGYGRSPAATTWYSETDDLLWVLRQVHVTHAAIVGSSHGGELSINFTLAHPEIVEQLVLIGPVVSGMPFTAHFLDRAASQVEAKMTKGDVRGAIAEWSQDRYLTAPGSAAARKRLFDLLTASPQDMKGDEFVLPSKPALPRLGEIHVPTLLLVGDADIPDVHAHAGAIEAGIPRARRIVISGVGHIMYLEKPAEVSRLIIDFLTRGWPD